MLWQLPLVPQMIVLFQSLARSQWTVFEWRKRRSEYPLIARDMFCGVDTPTARPKPRRTMPLFIVTFWTGKDRGSGTSQLGCDDAEQIRRKPYKMAHSSNIFGKNNIEFRRRRYSRGTAVAIEMQEEGRPSQRTLHLTEDRT